MNRPGATELRVFVYDTIASRGLPPASTEIGAHFGITPGDARTAIADARLGRTLFLDPGTGEIASAGPVAGSQTPYRVTGGGVTWFATSAWDMLGIAAMFGSEVSIDARCTDCGDGIRFSLDPFSFPAFQFPNGDSEIGVLVHFLTPARQWNDDTGDATTLFRNDEHLNRWLKNRALQRGAAVSLEQAWRLALAWFHDPREPEWRPRTRQEQQAVLESVGLRGPFWRL